MAYTVSRSVNFGKARTGLATVGYTLLPGGTRITAGVAEVAAGTGVYAATITVADDFNGTLLWDTGGAGDALVYAADDMQPMPADVRRYLGAAATSAGSVPTLPDIAAAVRDVSNAAPAANSLGAGIADKAGYSLSATGLDAIAVTAPAEVATTFPGMVVQTWRRFFRKTVKTATTITTYADDGTTVLTTETISSASGTDTKGAAT